jgi:hypothetical protein
MIIMAANAAGIAGSQVFRTQDKPLYHKAFTVILSMAALSWALVVGQMLWYYISNRSLTGKRRNEDKEDQPTGWRWTW